MVKLLMYKNYFHNDKATIENNDKKKLHQILNKEAKIAVDINILLNRVKIEKKYERKKKIFLYISTITILVLISVFLTMIK